MEVGLRLGLGKAEEDRHYTAAENIVRKRLEVEVQAEESAERTQRREVRKACPFWRCWGLWALARLATALDHCSILYPEVSC